MHDLQHRVLTGRDAFRVLADRWNDLWQRSHTSQPTVRSECIANWLDCFGRDESFIVVFVEQREEMVAAIPLLQTDLRGLCPVYKLPNNCWVSAGDLLIDREVEAAFVLDCLVQGLRQLPVSLFSFEEIPVGSAPWVEFRRAVDRQRGQSFVPTPTPVGVIDIRHDWDRYEASLSGNHRGSVRRSHRKLLKQGDVRIERFRSAGDELEERLRKAFEIEDRGWKGESGTSILKTPGMLEYMVREAQTVANMGRMDLWFLYLNDEPISFEYCHFSKGTCFSHKIGYDPKYAKFGPGRLLRYLQLQQYHADPECKLLDTLGTLCDSKAKWTTRSYECGRTYTSLGGPLSHMLLKSYAWSHPRLRSLRGQTPTPIPRMGAAGYLSSESPTQPI